jgi:hypothetical protein
MRRMQSSSVTSFLKQWEAEPAGLLGDGCVLLADERSA